MTGFVLRSGVPLLSKRHWTAQTRALIASISAVLPLRRIFIYYNCTRCLLHDDDDAYINFRYARNLATGQGLVFNPAERTYSASSFSFALLLAPARQ